MSARGQLSTNMSPFPPTYRAVHNYVETFNLDPSASGVIHVQKFRANGLYDPWESVGGHQPLGYDEMAVLYRKYTVIGAKIRITFLPKGTQAGHSYTVGIALRELTEASLPGLIPYIENGAKYVAFTPAHEKAPTLTMGYSAKKFHGVKDIMDNGSYGANSAGLPTKGANWHIFCGATDQSTELNPIQCLANIQYSVIWHDPIYLTQSN